MILWSFIIRKSVDKGALNYVFRYVLSTNLQNRTTKSCENATKRGRNENAVGYMAVLSTFA